MLDDHKKVKKKFIPKITIDIPFQEIEYTRYLLPEILWICLLYNNCGYEKTKKIIVKLSKELKKANNSKNAEYFTFQSNINMINIKNCQIAYKQLKKDEQEILNISLTPYILLFPDDNPFVKIIKNTKIPLIICKDAIEVSINNLIDRRDKIASIIQVMILEIDIILKNLNFISIDLVPNIKSFFDDMNSDEGLSIASRARMYINTTKNSLGINESWSEYFWNRITNIFPLNGPFPIRIGISEEQNLLNIFSNKFYNYSIKLINYIWETIDIKLNEKEVFEVIGAIMARQFALSLKIIENSDLWDFHVCPLILRTMTENVITNKWILKDPLERARKFIDFGLGQEKLYIEHLKGKLKKVNTEDEKFLIQGIIDSKTAWINYQHYTFLQNINIGSWSGISTRKMAEETDSLDYYNLVFTPWSFCTHNTWNHISIFNAKVNKKGVYNFLHEPYMQNRIPEVDMMFNAIKYLDELLTEVMYKFNLKCPYISLIDWFYENIDSIFEK